MEIDPSTLLFFDASCLIAAAGSPTGGSGFLLSLCARRLLRGAVSHVVLLEAEHNIQRKLGAEVLEQYHQLLQTTPLYVASVPTVPSDESWLKFVNTKDVHVVVALLNVRAPYFLTLDRKLIAQVNEAAISSRALTPGDFIQSILPQHVNFPHLRP